MDQLREALQTLVAEQQELAQKAAQTTPSLSRLSHRLVVLERYFIAVSRKGLTSSSSSSSSLDAVEGGEGERGGGGEGGKLSELPESGGGEGRGTDVVEQPSAVSKRWVDKRHDFFGGFQLSSTIALGVLLGYICSRGI